MGQLHQEEKRYWIFEPDAALVILLVIAAIVSVISRGNGRKPLALPWANGRSLRYAQAFAGASKLSGVAEQTGMNILVTGGAGYVGSHAARLLVRTGHEVWVYDNLSRGHRQAAPPGRLVEGELADGAALRRAWSITKSKR